VPRIFKEIQRLGNVPEYDMYKTLNMGLGMVLVAGKAEAARISEFLTSRKTRHYMVGEVVADSRARVVFEG